MHMDGGAHLNPASAPFFPGGSDARDGDFDAGLPFDRRPAPNVMAAVAPGEGSRTPSGAGAMEARSLAPSRMESRSAHSVPLDPYPSPAIGQVYADRPYPGVENRTARELSMAGSVDAFSEDAFGGQEVDFSPRDTFRDPFLGGGPTHRPRDRFMSFQGIPGSSLRSNSYGQGAIPESIEEGWEVTGRLSSDSDRSRPRMGSEPFISGTLSRARERPFGSMAVAPGARPPGNEPPAGPPFGSTSPVSSLHSTGSNMDTASHFDAQLKSSPLIHEILDRLLRCEFSTREIQRDLGDVHRKIDVLLERSAGATMNSAPEFKDPFSPQSVGSLGRRPSVGVNIAPNQPSPSSDMVTINQRLNTLTSSLGQLLALQTQNMGATNGVPGMAAGSQGLDMSPQMQSPPSASSAMRVLPTRSPAGLSPSLAQPNRAWSFNNADMSTRSSMIDLSPGSTPYSRTEGLLRDRQRRSVATFVRREPPVPVAPQPQPSADSWPSPTATMSPKGDTGPSLSKWEQLALSPELLRSLSKFGVGPPNKIQQRALPFLLRGADIIAQAPPTQERIAAYVIPAIQIVLNTMAGERAAPKAPLVLLVSTTVDQATQAQRMIRDLGGPIGVRSGLAVGATSGDVSRELGLFQQNMPHIVCGTPQKLHALFASPGGLPAGEVRFLVLDEVDQLIARNLHEYMFNIVKLLPPSRSRPVGLPAPSPGSAAELSPFDAPGSTSMSGFSADADGAQVERQTALFSNTVPQDVLNLATAINLREPVRVLVRRDGTVTHTETNHGTRGLRQFYLYLAFTTSGRADMSTASPGTLGTIGSGRGSTSAETAQAREWKLDALADLFDDVDVSQAVVYVGGMTALDAVVYKLVSRGVDAVPLHGDMNSNNKMSAITKFRGPSTMHMRQHPLKVLVIYDVQVKTAEVSQIPLIVNYDLPKAVEEYAHRVAPAIANGNGRGGVVINFVTATGGDVEMLRSIECFYKIKCPEVPMSYRDIF